MKISHKLILAFGVLILVLLVEIVLNQVISNRATQTYQTLQSEINPAVTILNKYEGINKELNLLISNRVNGDDRISSINRIKGIVEVELTYIVTELTTLHDALAEDHANRHHLATLIANTDDLIHTTLKFKDLLNIKEQENKTDLARGLYNTDFSNLTYSIDKSIKQLDINYNRAFESYNNELANNLKSVSRIILFTGAFGVILAIIITFQITFSISSSIHKLKIAALKMSKGNLDERIKVKGQNELAELGSAFNKMANALKKSFTAQEKQIEEIQSVNKELEQFVYVASHDLQEPLRTMTSYINLISELYIEQLDGNALKYMTHVEDASARMKTLIKDLLDYSKIGKEKTVTTVDLNAIVNEILLDHELIIKDSNATVVFDPLPTLNGLQMELKQLFQNLINNGLKFRKEGTDPYIEITVEDQSDFWLFKVKDNGIGMDEKYFERVFVIFQRLHNRNDYQGTGIGLSICKKIVDMHKGEIWIESELNKGCTFYFTIFKKLKTI